MRFFPIFLDIHERDCLVVGGGDVAARKVSLLLRAGGRVTVVAPELCERLKHAQRQGTIHYQARACDTSLLDRQALVVAATDDRDVNRLVSEHAHALNIPVNVVDEPSLCSFVMPSIVDRSPIVVAVSSSGASPVLARLLRARLETLIPAAYGKLARLTERFRGTVKERFANTDDRRRFWENTLQGPIAEMLFAGQEAAAGAALERAIEESSAEPATEGEVYLVGAGPGDPDLLTFRALRLMQKADVVLHDRLVPEAILDLTRRDADRIYVGKERSNHVVPQDQINDFLVELARAGKRVLRLKGGDPFIFGRGGEEIDKLADAGISFQVVPGITAASGCAAYSGIPLTHRDYSQSCVFVTGHLKDGSVNLNWPILAQPQQTVVIYMGLASLDEVCRQLIAHGLPEQHPAALVERGTTPDHRVVTGTLIDLPQRVEDAEVRPPTLIIVGEVVKLHRKLAWFQSATGNSSQTATAETSD